MAEYAASCVAGSDIAIETARHFLMDALGRGLEALRDPQCAALIGPIVPGAVMPGGARVPGTSLELEPAQAAFCIGLMLSRPAAGDHRLADSGAHAPALLGAILAVGDYRARKATMEGARPPKVRDVLTALLKALQIQGALAALDEGCCASGGIPLRCARLAAAAITAALLGGTHEQVVSAIGHACFDGDGLVNHHARHVIGHGERVSAEVIGRAVRHACQAVAFASPALPASADLEAMSLAGGLPRAGRTPARSVFGTALIDPLAGAQIPRNLAQLTTAFRATVDHCFPTRQAERVKALFAAPQRLDDLPVNELMAALVTNGAR